MTVRAALAAAEDDKPAAKMSKLDQVAAAALLLQAAELYRPLGYFVGVPSQQVNMAFIGLFAFYAIANGSTLLRLLNRPLGQIWAVVFLATYLMLGMQAIAGITTFDRFIYWSGYSSVFTGIFATSAIIFLKFGDRLVGKFLLALLAATWFGFVVNAFNYAFIREVLIYTSNRIGVSLTFDRLLGFYQHPNMAAFSIALLLAGLVTNQRFMRSSTLIQATVIAASVAGVIVTGSRTSTLLIAFVVVWYLGAVLQTSGNSKAAMGRAVAAPAALFVVALVAVGVVTSLLGRGSSLYETITSRLETLPALVTGDASNDASVRVRQQTFDAYVDRFVEKPFLGYGPDYARAEIDAGRIADVSQNSWLEWAVEFGFVYPLLIAVAFWITLRTSRRLRSFDRQNRSRVLLITGLVVLASFSIVELLALRAPVLILGMIVGLAVGSVYRAEDAAKLQRRGGDVERGQCAAARAPRFERRQATRHG